MLDGRCPDDINVPGSASAEDFISSKVRNLTNWLLPKIQNWEDLNDEEMLEATTSVYFEKSRSLASLTDPDAMRQELSFPQKLDRESHMFERLREALEQSRRKDHFGVIIIGEAHLLDVSDSLYNRCLRNGFVVERKWPHEQ